MEWDKMERNGIKWDSSWSRGCRGVRKPSVDLGMRDWCCDGSGMGKAEEGKVEQGQDEEGSTHLSLASTLLFKRENPKLLGPLALQVNKMNTH